MPEAVKLKVKYVYHDYYVRLTGDAHHPMIRISAVSPADAVQSYLRNYPSFGERGAWAWKIGATADGREVIGQDGLASYHEFNWPPEISNPDGAVLPIENRPDGDSG